MRGIQVWAAMIGWGVSCLAVAAWAQTEQRARPYSYGDFDRDIKYFVQQFKSHQDDATRRQAIVNLCQTYVALSCHPHVARSEQIRGMRSRVRHHLRDIVKQLEPSPSAADAANEIHNAADTATGSPGEQLQTASTSNSVWLENYELLLQTSGGPEFWQAAAGAWGGPASAEGFELVQLIQATIAPFHWDVNGGPGHVHFYAPQSLLVIRAGMDQHAEVGDLLQQLRDQQ